MRETIRRHSYFLGLGLLIVTLMVVQLLLPSCVLGQSESASVSGRVTDQSNAVVPDVEVELRNADTGVSQITKTSADGFYAFPYVRPGNYIMSVRKQGFRTVSITGITLNVQDNLSRNFALQVGASAVSITVTADTNNINTQDASVSTVVDQAYVANMPLNGRSFQTLLTLTPGVVLTNATFLEQGQFSVNGQRADANYFTVDGTSANIAASAGGTLVQTAGGALPGFTAWGGTNSLVSVDGMQEFRIQTSTFAPEFGRTPGAQVSIVTRSGSNQFHGTVFDYLRNDVLDANNWFNDRGGRPKPKDRQNDFGGVLGGPILRDHTFFFFSYEGLRLKLPQSLIIAVPSVAARQAVPPQIQPFLNVYPVPNGPPLATGFAQFAASYSDPATLNATSIRIDHAFGSKLSIFGRYNYAPSETRQRGGAGSGISSTQMNTHTLTVGLSHSLTSHLINEVRANYSKVTGSNTGQLDTFGSAAPISLSSVFPSAVRLDDSELSFTLVGAGTWFIGKNALDEQRQVNVLDNLSVSLGTHQLKFGVDYRHLSPINNRRSYDQFVVGNLTDPNGLLSGNAVRVLVDANPTIVVVSTNFSAYAQDTWKPTDRLTLTYGFRWDVNPPMEGTNGKGPSALQNVDNPATFAVAPAGTPLYHTSYTDLAPRMGVAYQLSRRSGRETVLRGGLGVFYDLGSGFLGQWTGSFPFSASKLLPNIQFPLTPDQAAPPSFASGPPYGTLVTADPNLTLPRTFQWNFAIEHSFGPRGVISGTYVGAIGRDLLRQEQFFRPNPTFSSTVTITRNTATSDYHGLQLQFIRRISHGLQALTSYTWAHSIDMASADSVVTAGGIDSPNGDRAASDFDIRHSFTTALSYEIPSLARGVLPDVFLHGWSIDTFLLARSATPVTIVAGNLFFPAFGATVRPDLVLGVPDYLYGDQFPGGSGFNRAAFALPPLANGAPTRQGTLGRNVLRGFGAWQVDFALRRQFHVTERLGLQFRAEFFNIFNHPNFGPPINNLANSLFGQSTQMLAASLGSGGVNGGFSPLYQVGGPRSIQLALKLVF